VCSQHTSWSPNLARICVRSARREQVCQVTAWPRLGRRSSTHTSSLSLSGLLKIHARIRSAAVRHLQHRAGKGTGKGKGKGKGKRMCHQHCCQRSLNGAMVIETHALECILPKAGRAACNHLAGMT